MATIYQILIPELAAVILKDDKVIAYGFMMPSINEVLRKGRGSVFLLHMLHIIRMVVNFDIGRFLIEPFYKHTLFVQIKKFRLNATKRSFLNF